MDLLKIEKVTYPDGTFYPIIENNGHHLLFYIDTYSDLWFLNQIADALKRSGTSPSHKTLIIPNLLDAQADRYFSDKSCNGLKLICQAINQMGWGKVVIFHPHNAEVVEALIDNVYIKDNSELLSKVLDDIGDTSDLVLLSPDAGAYKWLVKVADKIGWKGEIQSASKSRCYAEDGTINLRQTIPVDKISNKKVLIVDDLMIYGGTILGLSNMMREKAKEIYCCISHITVPNFNLELFDVTKTIYTSYSKNMMYNIRHREHQFKQIILTDTTTGVVF